jgi:hypothetical protein
MGDDSSNKVLLLIVGALAGVFSTLIASAYKSYLDRKEQIWKNREQTRREYLDPLRVASQELRPRFERVYAQVISEKDIPYEQLKESYNLRFWFRRCKDYIVDMNDAWTDNQRTRDFAMHSGGMGCDAMSMLYQTACYLYYATRIRLKSPYIQLANDDTRLLGLINDVRAKFSQLGFYSVTQDSTGVSMRNDAGEMRNFREFGEAVTSSAERAWYLTLADVYFKLHEQEKQHAMEFQTSLDNLITFLNSTLPGKS